MWVGGRFFGFFFSTSKGLLHTYMYVVVDFVVLYVLYYMRQSI